MDLQGDTPMTDIKDIIKTANVAVITGGASGIGLAAARRFAEAGMCIAIADRNADQLGAARDGLVYIGDSEIDMQTAENSGLDCISVDWGFRGRKFLEEHKAKTIVSRPEEILPLILG